jgi:E-phenylitaconyl-CoA hydratase
MSKVLYEKQDQIAVITLNRPEVLNAINFEMGSELLDVWRDFREDDNLRVAIVKGAGERAFSSGVDFESLSEWLDISPFKLQEQADLEPDPFGGLHHNFDVWKPKIAAINGYCLGGGFELALACDIRIASSTAQLGIPDVARGMIAGGGATQRLPRIIPAGLALEMLLTGRRVDAAEALRIGLVTQVVEPQELEQAALALAQRIAQNAPLAVRATAQAVWRGLHLPLNEGLRYETMLNNLLRSTDDVREGIRSFQEKRAPDFKGS